MSYIDGFLYIEPSLHPWDKAYLIMLNYCSEAFLDSGGQNFVSIFTSVVITEIGLKFSFFVGSLCGFSISFTIVSWTELSSSVPSVSILWSSLKSIGIRASL